ncbi:MAG: AraC family transcriptional regulator [Clostridiales bacterium]|nr:AraC family transcriptional regulator [Clostridiales bacterium]
MALEYRDFEKLDPLELFLQSHYEYTQNPSEENRRRYEEMAVHFSYLFRNGRDPFIGHTREDHSVTPESRYFRDGVHIVLWRHHRYSPINWHAHEFFELVYVWRGQCDQYIADRQFVMQQGDFCILPPNMMHTTHTDEEESIVVNILIRTTTFNQVFMNLLSNFEILSRFFLTSLYEKKQNSFLYFRCGDDPTIQSLIRRMYEEYYRDDPYTPQLLNGCFSILLGILLRYHRNDVYHTLSSSNTGIRVSKILSYITANLSDITLGQMAEYLGYNESYTSSLIKEITGRNFRDLVREQRTQEASRLLVSSDLPLSEIMQQVGYHDPSHFYKAFRTTFGMTPSQYRSEHQPPKEQE